MSHDVFISYSHQDSGPVEELVRVLDELNVSHFLDKKNINWGEEFHRRIGQGIADAKSLLVVVSRNSVDSSWVPYEIGSAAARQMSILPWLLDDLDEIPPIISHLRTVRRIDEIREHFEKVQSSIKRLSIVVAGSATLEYVGECIADGEMRRGHKQSITLSELSGGSGVNYASRLLAHGHDVLPLLPIGDDERGHAVQRFLSDRAAKGGVSPYSKGFIDSPAFFVQDKSLVTPFSFIVVDENGAQRTIFTQELNAPEVYIDHLENQLGVLQEQRDRSPSAMLVGHLYSDSAEHASDRSGPCTSRLVDAFGKHALTYVNPGRSQINLGREFWESVFPRIDVLQVNLLEAKQLFGHFLTSTSLLSIVNFVRERRLNTVITLDKFGAIGIYRDEREAIRLAWPILESQDVRDPTGAGDAFAAAMVSELGKRKDFSLQDFHNALDRSRAWAAYACTTPGGAGYAPTDNRSTEILAKARPTSEKTGVFMDELFDLLDIAFDA